MLEVVADVHMWPGPNISFHFLVSWTRPVKYRTDYSWIHRGQPYITNDISEKQLPLVTSSIFDSQTGSVTEQKNKYSGGLISICRTNNKIQSVKSHQATEKLTFKVHFDAWYIVCFRNKVIIVSQYNQEAGKCSFWDGVKLCKGWNKKKNKKRMSSRTWHSRPSEIKQFSGFDFPRLFFFPQSLEETSIHHVFSISTRSSRN